jgi:hypothetical protein
LHCRSLQAHRGIPAEYRVLARRQDNDRNHAVGEIIAGGGANAAGAEN